MHYQSNKWAERPGCMLREADLLGVKLILFFRRGKSLEFTMYTLI